MTRKIGDPRPQKLVSLQSLPTFDEDLWPFYVGLEEPAFIREQFGIKGHQLFLPYRGASALLGADWWALRRCSHAEAAYHINTGPGYVETARTKCEILPYPTTWVERPTESHADRDFYDMLALSAFVPMEDVAAYFGVREERLHETAEKYKFEAEGRHGHYLFRDVLPLLSDGSDLTLLALFPEIDYYQLSHMRRCIQASCHAKTPYDLIKLTLAQWRIMPRTSAKEVASLRGWKLSFAEALKRMV